MLPFPLNSYYYGFKVFRVPKPWEFSAEWVKYCLFILLIVIQTQEQIFLSADVCGTSRWKIPGLKYLFPFVNVLYI